MYASKSQPNFPVTLIHNIELPKPPKIAVNACVEAGQWYNRSFIFYASNDGGILLVDD
jgi:hypothetical protein